MVTQLLSLLSNLKTICLNNSSTEHITTPPYSLSSNGQAERAVKVMKDLLKKSTRGTFKSRLAQCFIHYRTVSHSTTQSPPCIALNSRIYTTLRNCINPNYTSYTANKQIKKIPQLNVGDHVLALNLRPGSKWYKATIVEILSINVYKFISTT